MVLVGGFLIRTRACPNSTRSHRFRLGRRQSERLGEGFGISGGGITPAAGCMAGTGGTPEKGMTRKCLPSSLTMPPSGSSAPD